VELHSADVLKALCAGDKIPDEQASEVGRPQSGGALSLGIELAIEELSPFPTGLTAKDRNEMILDKMRGNGGSVPAGNGAPRAIQRVFKRLKEQKSK
jgi:hypothetical protein